MNCSLGGEQATSARSRSGASYPRQGRPILGGGSIQLANTHSVRPSKGEKGHPVRRKLTPQPRHRRAGQKRQRTIKIGLGSAVGSLIVGSIAWIFRCSCELKSRGQSALIDISIARANLTTRDRITLVRS